jgi:hypothetical protein
MTAIALPTRKRRSRPARVAKSAAKTWASLKIGSTVARTAKKGVKAWGSWKVVKFVGRGGKKLVLVPVAVGGGVVAYKKLSSSPDDGPATPYGSSVGPAATPATVTPPKAAPGSDAGLNGEGALEDPPAGASNPPVTPPGSTS